MVEGVHKMRSILFRCERKRDWVVRIPLLGLLLMVLFGGGLTARAQYLRATFSDFEGDHLGDTDLIRMSLTFHQVTGAYEVVLESTENNRFGERFVLGINVFNADLGTLQANPTYFHDEAEVTGQACSVSIHRLRGTNSRLTAWSAGDRVAASGPDPLGVPMGDPFGDPFRVVSFTSGVAFLGDRETPEDAVAEGDSTVLSSVGGFEAVQILPDARDDLFSLLEDDGPTLLDVLLNDCSVILSPDPISIVDVSFPFVRGDVQFDARGITYTPPPNFFGIVRLDYTIQDLNGLTDTASVQIDVRSVNDEPVANDDIVSLEEDSDRVIIDPLESDSFEPDLNEVLTIVEVDDILGLQIVGNHIEYTPPRDFFGQHSVTYTISDGNGGFASAVIQLEVLSVNDPPFAGADRFEINGRLSRHSLDVLANDSISPDVGEQLVLLGVEADERLGTVRIEGSNIVVEPTGFFEGEGQISYTIGDGRGGEAVGSVVVTVVLPNLDPIALDDRFEILEDQAALFDPLVNDTTLPDLDEVLGLVTLGESESGASLFIEGDKIRYLPPQDFFGEDFFEYSIEDGRGGSALATVTVSVANTNDPPSVMDDRFETFEDSGGQLFDVLANDSAFPDRDELLTLESVELRNGEGMVGMKSGLLEFRPADDFNGLVEIDYRVEDGNQGSAIGVATIVVEPVNDLPLAKLDLLTVPAGQGVITIDVLENDIIAPDENEELSISAVFSNHVKGGEVSHDGKMITIIPIDGFHGTESFRYVVSDGNGGQSSALVVLTIVTSLMQPVAMDDEVELLEDTIVTIEVLANDTIDPDEQEALALSIVRDPELGTAQVVDGNQIEYRAASDFFGQDSLEYQIAYTGGELAVGVLNIVVINQNDPPTANNDQFTIEEDSGSTPLLVLDNDTFLPDPEERLTVIAVTPTESGGEVTLSEGQLSYRPPAHFFGADSFSYAIRDESGEVANASVAIVVNSVNDPPQLMDDSLSIAAETVKISIDVLSNDSTAPELDERLELIGVTQGENGAKVSIEDGMVIYEPAAGFIGADRFTYSAGDGNGGVALAEVNVTVFAVAKAPRALADVFDVREDDVGVRLGVLENDQSGAVADAALEILSVTQGSNGGRLEIDGSGVIYSPTSDFFGIETFAYRLIEKGLESDLATVTVMVLPENDPPLAVNDLYAFENPDEILVLDVLINDSIAPDEGETLAIIEFPAGSMGGRIEELDGVLHYTAFSEFEGTDRFEYSISDGNGGVSTASVIVEINRFDVTPPVVVCRDLEVVLDGTGFVIIEPSQIDAGSVDESGELRLEVLPNRFGVEDVGLKSVILRGEDGAGNISECVATISILPIQVVEASIVNPADLTSFVVDEFYSFVAADVPVEILVKGPIQSLKLHGDGKVIAEFKKPFAKDRIDWVWEEVLVGDHQLYLETVNDFGVVIESLPVRFSVSELGARVAVVLPDFPDLIAKKSIQQFLFEMGVNARFFSRASLPSIEVAEYELLIWGGQSEKGITETSLVELERLRDQGMSFYFIGKHLLDLDGVESEDIVGRWTDLLQLERASGAPLLSGELRASRNAGPGIGVGRFGSVIPFDLTSIVPASAKSGEAESLFELDENDVVIRLNEVDGERTNRRVVQIFSVSEPFVETVVPGRKVLFQNAVCWLLEECRDCQNANLPPVVQSAPSQVGLGEVFSVGLSIENNGACEITGAKVGLSGDGVSVEGLLVDGQPIPVLRDEGADRWYGNIGRVGRGSIAARIFEWQIRILSIGTSEIVFDTVSNNTELSKVGVPIIVEGLRYRLSMTAEGELDLVIEGAAGSKFAVEVTDQLTAEINWQSLVDGEGVLEGGSTRFRLPVVPGTGQQFYRVISP
jgi:hypothetical protein